MCVSDSRIVYEIHNNYFITFPFCSYCIRRTVVQMDDDNNDFFISVNFCNLHKIKYDLKCPLCGRKKTIDSRSLRGFPLRKNSRDQYGDRVREVINTPLKLKDGIIQVR